MEHVGLEVVASALIVRCGLILLVKSQKWGETYLMPGGHLELGETIFEAVKREGEEETGLRLEPLHCVNVGELIFDPAFHRKAHLIYFHFLCEAKPGEIKLERKELKEFLWIEPKSALNLRLAVGIKQSIQNYLGGFKYDITSNRFL